jgi:predicted Zn-dependent peptidase
VELDGSNSVATVDVAARTTMVQDSRSIEREVLPNGLIVLTEEMQHIRSVSIGIWVKTGSRHEEAEVNGISHFVEHMVFKGTKTRTAEDIARQIDSIGGNMDAFTAKECICFNVKVLDEHLPIALDVLSDLVLNPTFDAQDITRERGVILEEIKMDEDNPGDERDGAAIRAAAAARVLEQALCSDQHDHQRGRPAEP